MVNWFTFILDIVELVAELSQTVYNFLSYDIGFSVLGTDYTITVLGFLGGAVFTVVMARVIIKAIIA